MGEVRRVDVIKIHKNPQLIDRILFKRRTQQVFGYIHQWRYVGTEK